jgi:hypothetical protein
LADSAYREAATAGRGMGVVEPLPHYKPAAHNKIQYFRELLNQVNGLKGRLRAKEPIARRLCDLESHDFI